MDMLTVSAVLPDAEAAIPRAPSFAALQLEKQLGGIFSFSLGAAVLDSHRPQLDRQAGTLRQFEFCNGSSRRHGLESHVSINRRQLQRLGVVFGFVVRSSFFKITCQANKVIEPGAIGHKSINMRVPSLKAARDACKIAEL